jgi:hypothetical protein
MKLSEKDERHTATEWLAANGLHAKPFSKSEIGKSKTPDFRLFRDGRHVGFCEVKSSRPDERLNNKLAAVEAPQIVGVIDLRVSIYNRLSDDIKEAAKQFYAVNPTREFPNILVLINRDSSSRFADLHETLIGFHDYSGEDGLVRDYSQMSVAEGHMIGKRKYCIDLYVWIDWLKGHRPPRPCYVFGDIVFRAKVCGWLGIDPSKIDDVS